MADDIAVRIAEAVTFAPMTGMSLDEQNARNDLVMTRANIIRAERAPLLAYVANLEQKVDAVLTDDADYEDDGFCAIDTGKMRALRAALLAPEPAK